MAGGTDLGVATCATMIKSGGEILFGNRRRSPVLGVVPFNEEELPFVGLLQIEAA